MWSSKTYLNVLVLVGLLIAGWAGAAQAVDVSFVTGDEGTPGGGDNRQAIGSCVAGAGECVRVNTTNTYNGAYFKPEGTAVGTNTAFDVYRLDGVGSPTALNQQNTGGWYIPTTDNPLQGGSQTLNQFTGKTAQWISYTSSGIQNNGLQHPDIPAVFNYCGTTVAGGGTAGNANPTGNPTCSTTIKDSRGNQALSNLANPTDNTRTSGNRNALFSQTVNTGPGTFNLEFYAWADDVIIMEVIGPAAFTLNGPGGSTSNPFPASTGTGTFCAGSPVSCAPTIGGQFTASGLSGGTYTFNMYAFQTGSDTFGVLLGGLFTDVTPPPPPTEIPEPATVLLLGAGLAGLGLIRRVRKVS